MTTLRICHIVNLITGNSDGVFAHLSMLARTMDRERYEHIIVFQGGADVERELAALGVEMRVVPSLKERWPFRATLDVYRIVRSVRPDVLHVHMMKPFVIIGVLNIVLRIPALWNYHGSFIRNREYYTTAEEWAYRLMYGLIALLRSYAGVLVPSEQARTRLRDEAPLLPPMHVYYNGCDVDHRPASDRNVVIRHGKNSGQFHVAAVMRMGREKRPDRAVRIALGLSRRRSDVRFHLIGDGPLETEIRTMVGSLGLEETVTVHGFVPDVAASLNGFDLVLLTSDREGMPMVMWEAMAAGVPFVSTDVGGIREIVEPADCGAVFPTDDEEAGIGLIDALLSDPVRRAAMGRNGRTVAAERYSARHFAERMEELYRMTLGEDAR